MTDYNDHGEVERHRENITEGAEHNPPSAGGCWFCETGNGWEDDDMKFDTEFDTFYHQSCLEEHDVDSVLEYERA